MRTSRDFRLVFTGAGVSALGSYPTYVSIPDQVFTLTHDPPLVGLLFFLTLAGAADMISGIFRMIIWNQTIPDHRRGRLAGIEMLSYTIGPTLGNARAGAGARLFGVGGSIVWGGVARVACTVALAASSTSFLRYDGRDGLARKLAEDEAWASRPLASVTGEHVHDGGHGESD